jgi:hypothetical protein
MTKDFRYKGFTSPNGTIVPDDVFDVLAPELTEAELRVLLYVIRKTFGWKKNEDAISISQMVNGVKTRDGRIIDKGTGMSKSAVWRGANGLVAKGILNRQQSQSENGEYETNVYSLRFSAESSEENIRDEKSENRGVSLQESNPISPKEPPLLSERDTVSLQKSTQQTSLQTTSLQQTDFDLSNIRKSTRSNNHFVDNSVSQPIRSAGQNGHTDIDSTVREWRGMEGVGEVIKRKRGRPRKYSDETSQTILNYVADFSREFADKATVNQSAARFINDYHKWGRGDMDAFIGVLYQARSITKSQAGVHNRFAYFAEVVEDLLGLKDHQTNLSLTN